MDKILFTGLLLALAGPFKVPTPRGRRRDRLRSLYSIDAHTHADFSGELERTSKTPKTEAEYFREWKEAGITGAVSHEQSDGTGAADLRSRNVVTCAGAAAKVDAARIEAGLKTGRYGCIKKYLGYVHQWAYDENYEPGYRLAGKQCFTTMPPVCSS
jgi:hypothetical protein